MWNVLVNVKAFMYRPKNYTNIKTFLVQGEQLITSNLKELRINFEANLSTSVEHVFLKILQKDC